MGQGMTGRRIPNKVSMIRNHNS